MADGPYTIHDRRFRRYAMDNAALEELGRGFRWLEGPLWWADAGVLLFSDIPDNRVMRWSASSGAIDTWRADSQYANGAARDRQGRILHCHHGSRCISRTEHDGSVTVLADRHDGRRLNAPNDIVVKSDGTIWFSDPNYGLLTDYQGNRAEQELPPAVYRFDPAEGSLAVVSTDFVNPNGLCFSPDERVLYISETGEMFDPGSPHHIACCTMSDDGSRITGTPRRFAAVKPGFADGFCCDEDGNLWTSGADGVHCLDAHGTLLGTITTPCTVSNLCFGGPKRNRLFLCASQTLLAIYVNTRGA